MNRNIARKSMIMLGIIIVLPLVHLPANGGAEEEARDQQAVTPAGEFPIVNEKITVRALMPTDSWEIDYKDNDFTRYLEDKTNIFLEVEISGNGAEADRKRNILLATNDYPEVFIDAYFNRAEQQIYGSQGVFIPLNDLIAEYGINTRKVFADFPLVKENMTMPDGNIYSLPDVNQCFHCSFGQKMWIYQPWLEELGLEMPTTTEEFKDVLIAFRDRDPNGNGLKDEIPLAGALNSWNGGIDGFIMNAFIYTNQSISGSSLKRTYIDNGMIEAAFVQDAWREGLAYLNSLYEEGLLLGDSFVQDGTQYQQLGGNPDAVILGTGTGATMFNFVGGGTGDRWLDYKAVPPLEGPGGVRIANYSPEFGSVSWTVTDRASNPEAAFRLGDAFYELDVMMHNLHGREGIEWAWAEEGEIGINGLPAIYKTLIDTAGGDGDFKMNSFWDQRGPQVRSPEFRLGRINDGPESVEVVLYEETKNKMEPYQVPFDMILPPLTYSEDQSAELVDLENSLRSYVVEMIGRFVVGDADIQAEWDEYLAELEKIGLPRYLEIMQEAYDNR